LEREHFTPPIQQGQPLADKIIASLLVLGFFAQIAFIPLDVFRLYLMDAQGWPVSSFGLIVADIPVYRSRRF